MTVEQIADESLEVGCPFCKMAVLVPANQTFLTRILCPYCLREFYFASTAPDANSETITLGAKVGS